ncbi:16S rRNA (uracil(1498)-N(3))-methyltransferase [Bacteroidota bacterium]
MPVFLVKQINDKEALLDEVESRHIARVLRLKKDDPVELVDGTGNFYRGVIDLADQHSTRVRILETIKDYLKRDYYLHLAIAPTKSAERFEWFLEKSTEIGIDEITPILCQRSERDRIRHDRSERILQAAMKQSGRALLPKLNAIVTLEDFLTQSEADLKYIAHCGTSPTDQPSRPVPKNQSWLILVGPEGDFTPEELKLALEENYVELNLGEAVYRTETAGIMACQLIRILNMEL